MLARGDTPTLSGYTTEAIPTAPDGKDVVLHTRVVTGTGGGPDKTILLSSPFLQDTNYWLAAAYMHPPEDPGFATIQQRAENWNSPLIGVPDRGACDRKVFRSMLNLCKHYNVKIWHGHDYKSNLIGLMLRPFWKMKLVTTVHGWVKHTLKTPLYYAVDRWSLPFYQHVICVSDDLHERVLKLRIKPDRCSWIPNAIDEQAFKRQHPSSAAEMRKKWNTPADRLVIGAVGRLSPEKGFDRLINAATTLIKEGVDFEVWIAGEGDAKDDLQKQISESGHSDRIKLIGFCEDTIGLYHALDVFVLSSLREGLPNVVLEAASMDVPVVSTLVAGVPKMLTDGKDGLLVPIADTNALTTAIRRVLTDKDLRHNLAANARQLIETKYSFKNRMAKVKSIYDQVLGQDVGRNEVNVTATEKPSLPVHSAP